MTKTVCALFAVASLWAAVPAVAGNMGADEARRFVVGNLFSFTCFEGTSGEGRVYADGSVGGVIRLGGSGPKWSAVRGMLRARSHGREELSRFARCKQDRVLPIHQAGQSGRNGPHIIAALHPADYRGLKPAASPGRCVEELTRVGELIRVVVYTDHCPSGVPTRC